jgi:hypothetical protein
MPERNIEFGKYGARGIKGHEAVARQLDALAGRGLLARLHYLTRIDHARNAARAAGLTVTDRTLRAWRRDPNGTENAGWRRPRSPRVGHGSCSS